ncbi:MAG: hypothetical protein IK120_05180 [Muribaculaceae bacterium]|nr:hypothetical protein [Muribaculaceae bacterium]
MKKLILSLALFLPFAACTSEQTAAPAEGGEDAATVAFTVAKNYFFKNDKEIPANPKITTEEQFSNLFGMATVMGENGKPTAIDFSKEFVLAIVLPVTDVATEIIPLKIEEKDKVLDYCYEVKTGEKLSYEIRPCSIIILDKKYENYEVNMVKK